MIFDRNINYSKHIPLFFIKLLKLLLELTQIKGCLCRLPFIFKITNCALKLLDPSFLAIWLHG